MHMIKIAVSSTREAYEAVGLDPNKTWSDEDFNKAFKKTMAKNHPDLHQRFGEDAVNEATKKSQKANQARDFINNRGQHSQSYWSEQKDQGRGNHYRDDKYYEDIKDKNKSLRDIAGRMGRTSAVNLGVAYSNRLNPDLKSRRKINRINLGSTIGNIGGGILSQHLRNKGKITSNQAQWMHRGSIAGGAGLGYAYDKVASKNYIYDDDVISSKKYDFNDPNYSYALSPEFAHNKEKGVGDRIRAIKATTDKQKKDRNKKIMQTALLGSILGASGGAFSAPSNFTKEVKQTDGLGKNILIGALSGGLTGGYVGHKAWQASKYKPK